MQTDVAPLRIKDPRLYFEVPPVLVCGGCPDCTLATGPLSSA